MNQSDGKPVKLPDNDNYLLLIEGNSL
jgi:hypothetical protein